MQASLKEEETKTRLHHRVTCAEINLKINLDGEQVKLKDKPDVKSKEVEMVKTEPDAKLKVIAKPNIEPNEKHKQDVKPNIKSNKELKHDTNKIDHL